jgi:hypothetical protein
VKQQGGDVNCASLMSTMRLGAVHAEHMLMLAPWQVCVRVRKHPHV